MNTTGIIRRLDELGRIVIPRELRKAHRINCGDPLSIRGLENGDILISKLDIYSDIVSYGSVACFELNRELNRTVMCATTAAFVTGSGKNHETLEGTALPEELRRKVSERASGAERAGEESALAASGFSRFFYAPVMSMEEVFGALFVFGDEPLREEEEAVVKLTARILGGNLQKY